MILAFAIVGTAVTLFPVVKRQNEAVALGYVGLRTLEAGIIAVGLVGQYSVWPAVAAIPEFAWELTLAIWLIAKGFTAFAIAAASAKPATNELPGAA